MTMNRKPRSGQEAASALEALFNATDDLSCEQAQQLLPSLVDNERAGVDIDQVPGYAALLQHLDHCADCIDLYETLSEKLEVLMNEHTDLPPANVSPPPIFSTGRRSDQVMIRVLQGLKRRFALDIAMPALRPSIDTLGAGAQLPLFSGKLPELTGNPFVSVALRLGTGQPELVVAVLEGMRPITWQVQLQIGEHVYSTMTDEHGMARITGFTARQLQEADELAVSCAEIVTQQSGQ